MKPYKYEFVYPRSLQVGDTVLIYDVPREIVRINANRIRVTVYFLVQRVVRGVTTDVQQGYTYWVAVGEIRAKAKALGTESEGEGYGSHGTARHDVDV